MGAIQPHPGRFEFEPADAYVRFAIKHKMAVIGHTLVWHSQTPEGSSKEKMASLRHGRNC
jgi:endo-1,4-beta-xylanase